MGRRVKCQITEEYGDSEEFYKAPNNKYYKSKTIYKQYKREDIARQKANETLMELLQLKSYPPMLGKVIKGLHENYSYEVIYLTVLKANKGIKYAVENKYFKTQYHKIKYIEAILKNEIIDTYQLYKHKTNKKHQKIKIDGDVYENQRTNRRKKDISKWLE